MDLKGQQQNEEQLRQSEQYAWGIVNSSIEGIISTDSDQLITHFNPAAEKMFGYAAGQVVGKSLDILIPSSSRAAHKRHILGFAKSNVTRRVRFQAHILKSIDQAVIVTTPAGIITYVNQFAETMYGWAATDAIGKNIMELTVPQISSAQAQEIMASLREGRNWQGEFMAQRQDGSIIMVQAVNTPIMDKHGNITAIAGISSDITQRKEADELLKQSEINLKEAQSIAKMGRWEFNRVTNQLLWSDSVFEIFEIDKEQFGATYEAYLNTIHPDDRQLVNDTYTRSIETKQPYEIEHRLQMADGRIKYLKGSGRTDYDGNGKALKSIGIVQDITEQKQAEDTLRENQARFEMALIAGNQGAWILDWQKKKNIVDERWAAMLGYSLEEVGQNLDFWESKVHPDDLKEIYSAFEQHQRGEISMIDVEVRARIKNGEWKWISDRAQILKRTPSGQPWVMAGIHTDITDRKKSELALQESEKKFRELFENLVDEVHLWKIIKDKNGKITGWQLVDANPSALKAWGKSIDEIIGKTANEIFGSDAHGQFMPIVEEIFKTYKPYHWENYFAPTGQYLYMESIPFGDYFISTGKDITEQKEAELELKATQQKLESIFGEMEDVVWSMAYPSLETLFVTPSVEQLYGYPMQEWMGKGSILYQQVIHPEDRDLISQMFERLKKDHKVVQSYRVITADGITKWVNSKLRLITDQHGVPFRLDGQVQDITERKRIEEKLKRNNQLLEASQAIAKVGGWELDLITNHLFWTAETYRIHDTSPEEFNPTVDAGVGYFLPESKKQISEALELAMTKGIGYDLYLETYTTKGRRIDVRTTCEVTLVDGKPTKLTGIFQDITEQKKTQNELETLNTRLSIAAEAAKIGVWEFFFKDQKLIWDDKMFELFNVSKSTFSGTYEAWRSTVHPGDLERIEKDLQNAIACGQSFNSEFRIVWRDKSIHHIKGMAESVRDSNGNPYKMIGVNYDITEQKEAQHDLEKSNARLSLATQSAHIGIWEFLIEEDILIWEDETLKLFGLTRESFSGNYQGWKSTVHPEDIDEAEQKIREAIANKTILNMEFRTIWPDKTIRYIGAFGKPILDDTGRVIKLVGTNYDVTERVQKEIELLQAKEKAEESDRLKTAFLANMSHEIRTPMNGIMGFASLLQKENITPQKEKEYLAMIQKSGDRMLNIINDIISISKIEAGEINVTLSPTNINEQLEFISSFFDPEASEKGIKIVITSALPEHKAIVSTDQEKVYGTLTNLVKNALKFTHEGTIELGCREKPEQAELEFFVKDKGIGIAPDQLGIIFERFRQVNDSSTRNYEGAGLGLAISKAQVEKLGGKMWVESEVGKGSTFYFTIPCQRDLLGTKVQAAESDPSKNKVQSHQRIKIVLAEDDLISATFLKAVLSINDNEILHATTGTEAVDIVRNNPDTDVVLMDLSMPELNGYEATSQIRQFNKAVVIIVQSGYAFKANIKQATEAGCTDYISKPVNENELLGMIAKHVRK